MSGRSSGFFYKTVLWLMLISSMAIAVRAGYHLGLWLTYQVFGRTAEAVIEESYPFRMTVRKPRPTRYVTSYYGTYGFDLFKVEGKSRHFTGKFDESYFLTTEKEKLQKGARLAVLYLPFIPSCSKPEEYFGLVPLFIACLFFSAAAIVGSACALILWFLAGPEVK